MPVAMLAARALHQAAGRSPREAPTAAGPAPQPRHPRASASQAAHASLIRSICPRRQQPAASLFPGAAPDRPAWRAARRARARMLQHRLVAAAGYAPGGHRSPAELHPVELVVAVTRAPPPAPAAAIVDSAEPRRPALDRDHLRAIPRCAARPGTPRYPPASPHPRPARTPPGTATTAPAPAHTTSPCSARPAEHPQVFQELLSRADRPAIAAQHRPGPFPARQYKPLRPALPVTFSHAPQRNGPG